MFLLEDVCDAGIQEHQLVVGLKDLDGIEGVRQVVVVVVPGPRLLQMVRNKVLREKYLSPLSVAGVPDEMALVILSDLVQLRTGLGC